MNGASDIAAYEVLMPMHVLLGADGRVLHAGPTLTKLARTGCLVGQSVFDAFGLRAPRGIDSMAALMRHAGRPLRLELHIGAPVRLRGVVMPVGDAGQALLNLSFGINEIETIGSHALTCTDFAPTDLTLDMLYLNEAKTAAMAESRRLVGRLQAARIAAEEQAFTDTLTGLKNRRALFQVLARTIERGRPFALTLVDLDYFKEVNDSLGHAAGDQLLREVASALVDETRAVDTVARIGGDEFVVVLDGLDAGGPVERLAGRLLDRLGRPLSIDGQRVGISASLGSTLSRVYDSPSPDDMLRDADAALYSAKAAGRGCHAMFPAATPAGPDEAGSGLSRRSGRR